MKQSEMTAALSEKTGLRRTDIATVLEALADTARHVLAGGGEWKLLGFGTFVREVRAARKGRNPRTGAAIDIAATTIAKFRPSTTLRDELNPKRPAERARRQA
jgi:DNA-binding protein HU-beta